jgi:hypothetical protein
MGKEACLFSREGLPGRSSGQPFFAAWRALRENAVLCPHATAERHDVKREGVFDRVQEHAPTGCTGNIGGRLEGTAHIGMITRFFCSDLRNILY